MRKVIIGTPCYDGRLDVWYVNSLVNTCKMAESRGIEIIPLWVSFDALIQRARNDTVHVAMETDCTDLVWIDSDIEWQPEWFYRLLDYPEDIVGGTYRKKGDNEEYVVRQMKPRAINSSTGLLEVDGLGTGFVKMSRSALQYLWDNSKKYIDPKDGKERSMVFDVVVEGSDLISEDITAFKRLAAGGYKIWLDPTMTCNHIGSKKYTGDFLPWWKNISKNFTGRQL